MRGDYQSYSAFIPYKYQPLTFIPPQPFIVLPHLTFKRFYLQRVGALQYSNLYELDVGLDLLIFSHVE